MQTIRQRRDMLLKKIEQLEKEMQSTCAMSYSTLSIKQNIEQTLKILDSILEDVGEI